VIIFSKLNFYHKICDYFFKIIFLSQALWHFFSMKKLPQKKLESQSENFQDCEAIPIIINRDDIVSDFSQLVQLRGALRCNKILFLFFNRIHFLLNSLFIYFFLN